MTNQEIFTKMVTHLRKQGRRSWRQSAKGPGNPNGCLYRGEDEIGPTMCAAGVLLKDEYYRPEFESLPTKMGVRSAFFNSGVNLDDRAISNTIKDVMLTHDKIDPYKWECEFKRIADEYNLILEAA